MKTFFRSLSAIALVVAALTACTKKELPELSFQSNNAFVEESQTSTVKLLLSKAADTQFAVPFTVEGTAVEGTDYTISAKQFTFAAGASSAEIEINHLGANAEDKSLTLNLQAVSGYALGMNKTMIISLRAAEKVIWSFSKMKAKLSENSSIDVSVSILGEKSGANYKSASDIVLPLKFSDGSTAKQGSDFTTSASELVIPAGKTSATVTFTAGDFDKTADPQLFFDVTLNPASAKYVSGTIDNLKVTLAPLSSTDELIGTWEYSAYVDEDAAENGGLGLFAMLAEEIGQAIEYPLNNTSEDKFTIAWDDEKEAYTFVPSMEGDVARFFRECTIADPTAIDYKNSLSYTVYKTVRYTFSSVNFYFSREKEELRSAKILLKLSEDKKTLDLFILNDQYEPTDYMGNLYHYDYLGDGSWWGKGEFAAPCFDLHYRFVRE